MKLTPACKDYLWGGNRLRTEYHKTSTAQKIAETWELSCHPDGPSTIENGEYAGLTLPEYFGRAGKAAMGTDCEKFPDFPVLIKLIDARDNLSIQVHPDDAYARAHGERFGKTEMWYIVDCEPGAALYYGFDHSISQEEFKQRIESNTLPEVLNRVPVHPGDVFMIRAGTLHAIGAGILIAEIQQSSNLTYRVYDYGRIDKDGKPRQLHIQQALDVTRRERPEGGSKPEGETEQHPHYERTLLKSCDIFTVRHMNIREVQLDADQSSFHSLLCLDGDAIILQRGKPLLAFQKGDSVFIPAGMGDYVVKGDCRLLLTTV